MSKSKRSIGEKYNSPFAKSIRELMSEQGTTQDVLAEKIGKTRQTVSQYVNGISEPGYDTLVKIADHFGVSTDYLLGRSVPKTVDTTAQAVIAYTGLSEDNVRTLHNAAESSGGTIIAEEEDRQLTFDGNKPFLDCLNDLLDAVFYDRETIVKHYIRLRRTTVKSDSIDLWYLMGHPTPIVGFEPRRYSDHSAQCQIDNELVEYDCLKIAKEIEKYLKDKYIAGQDDLNQILEEE